MGLETGNYIDDLNSSNPASGDQKSEGDDHFRLIKLVVKQTFPGMTGRAWRNQSKSASYTGAASDNMSCIQFTGGYTLNLTAAATLGNGWMCLVQGDAAITVDPNAAETINGAATLTVPVGYIGFIYCTGTAFFAFIALKAQPAALQYRLISTTVYTSGSGTHTYNARTTLRRARLVGAGGGGGGSDGQGTPTTGPAGGGGGGGYVEDVSDPAATEAYAVGAAGAAGAAAAGDGGTGGNTTLGALTGSGGVGGTGSTGANNTSSSAGGAGGAASGGNVMNVAGKNGSPGRRISGVAATIGTGGDSILGTGGQLANVTAAAGVVGGGYGAGGSGAIAVDETTNRDGAAGTAGLIIIEEYTND